MNLQGNNIIGHSLSDAGQNMFRAVNPTDGSLSDSAFRIAAYSDIEAAMNLADQAMPVLSGISPEIKASFLEQIAENILAAGDRLVETVHFETGLPVSRIIGERGRTISQIKMFVNLIREGSWVDATIDTGDPHRQPAPKPDLRKMLFPIGPVVVFGASNFPLAFSVAGGDTISALAGGNPVIFKAHPAHPGTCQMVGECIQAASISHNMPEGTFSMLHDSGYSVGQALVTHASARAVGFTGSFRGGKSLFDLAMKRPEPIPVFAEMSSVNPIFVLPSALTADSKALADKIAGSVTLGAGQFCTNPGLILVINDPETRNFMDHLAFAIRENLPQTMLTPSIAGQYNQGYINILNTKKVTVLAQSSQPAVLNQGTPSVATVSGDDFENNPDLAEEIFGPFSLVILCRDAGQLTRIAGKLNGQLTSTLFYQAEEELDQFGNLLLTLREKAGRIVFNGVPTGVEVCPAMQHGGPFPSSTDSRFSSVGTSAILRWVRPVAYQDCPDAFLPEELKNGNPRKIRRTINGEFMCNQP